MAFSAINIYGIFLLQFFVHVNLPYAEDEHLFKLPSLKPFAPNDEQKNAVRNLINAMDLDDEK